MPTSALLHRRLVEIVETRRFTLGAPAHAQPIRSVRPPPDPIAKRRVRPRMRAGRESVLDRVVMNVIAMPSEISIVTNGMLPEPPVPDAAFPVPPARSRDRALDASGGRPSLREGLLHQGPTRREIRIFFREPPKAMQMVRQQHHREDVEGPRRPRLDERLAQKTASEIVAEEPPASMGHDGKEERPTRFAGTTILGHGAIVPFGAPPVKPRCGDPQSAENWWAEPTLQY